MTNVLAHLRRANAALAVHLEHTMAALHTKRRAQIVAVVAVSALVSLMVLAAYSNARHARAAWGTTLRVVVAARDLQAGEALNSTNTEVVNVPIGLVADDALESLPIGATVRLALAVNTVLTESMISGGTQSPTVPEGWRVVAMAADVTAPALSPGDKVDVVSTDSVLASGAIVVTAPTESQGPSIAVPQDVAAVVATAAREGTASLVLAG